MFYEKKVGPASEVSYILVCRQLEVFCLFYHIRQVKEPNLNIMPSLKTISRLPHLTQLIIMLHFVSVCKDNLRIYSTSYQNKTG